MQKTEEGNRVAGAARPDEYLICRGALPECCPNKAAANRVQRAQFPVCRRASVLARSPNQGTAAAACLPTPRVMSCFSSSRCCSYTPRGLQSCCLQRDAAMLTTSPMQPHVRITRTGPSASCVTLMYVAPAREFELIPDAGYTAGFS